MLRTVVLFLALFCAAPAWAQSTKPAWFAAHVEFMTRDGGRWMTSNPDASADPALPDAYVLEWRAANEGHLLIGRLAGLRNGAEIAEYWTYREFWHPGEQRVILEQWGASGVYGVGESSSPEPGQGRVAQTFWLPDGRAWREGHRTVENGDVYVTEQFNIGDDGEWTPNGTFIWRRVRAQE